MTPTASEQLRNKKKGYICQGKNKKKGYVGIFLDFTYGNKRRNCNKKASDFENGKWYCKRHAPSEIKKREEKSELTELKRLFPNEYK